MWSPQTHNKGLLASDALPQDDGRLPREPRGPFVRLRVPSMKPPGHLIFLTPTPYTAPSHPLKLGSANISVNENTCYFFLTVGGRWSIASIFKQVCTSRLPKCHHRGALRLHKLDSKTGLDQHKERLWNARQDDLCALHTRYGKRADSIWLPNSNAHETRSSFLLFHKPAHCSRGIFMYNNAFYK